MLLMFRYCIKDVKVTWNRKGHLERNERPYPTHSFWHVSFWRYTAKSQHCTYRLCCIFFFTNRCEIKEIWGYYHWSILFFGIILFSRQYRITSGTKKRIIAFVGVTSLSIAMIGGHFRRWKFTIATTLLPARGMVNIPIYLSLGILGKKLNYFPKR